MAQLLFVILFFVKLKGILGEIIIQTQCFPSVRLITAERFCIKYEAKIKISNALAAECC